jgi:hypothetical protein
VSHGTRLSRFLRRRAVVVAVLAVATAAATYSAPSCQTYEPPPTATIAGLSNGILKDPLAPIVVQFSTPVDPSTVSVEIAPFDIDSYGNLPDERPDGGSLEVLVAHTPTADTHTTATFSQGNTVLTLVPAPLGWLPTGPSLVLLVLPGLKSATGGTELHYRERIPFSYPASCGTPRATQFQSGAYFFLLQVAHPIGVDLKVFAAIDVNPETGAFFGQFTAALRNADPTRCSPPCTGGNVCELIPSQMCVQMSAPPTSVYESPDFVPKATAPNGYTFEMHGCASDDGDAGAVNILTAPGVLNVSVPAVSIEGLTFTAQFAPVDGGRVLGSGSLTATKILLGSLAIDGGSGTLSALSIPDAEVPPDLPQPGTLVDAGEPGDAGDGSDAGSAGGGG